MSSSKKSQAKKVLLNRQALRRQTKAFKRFINVEFPELSGKMGFPEDSVPYLRIKAASLDDHIRCNTIAEKAAIMGIRIAETIATKKDPLKLFDVNWITAELKKPENEKTMLEVSLFHRCVVKPKFSLRDGYVISKMLPEVVHRVAMTALSMSSLESVNGHPERSQSNNIGSGSV